MSATLIASRFAWVVALTSIAWLLSPRLREPGKIWPLPHQLIISWAGMRGVVSLAAALALPEKFPTRDMIVILAFSSILATLVLQGTTLGWVIRRLRGRRKSIHWPDTQKSKAATAALGAVKSRLGDNSTSVEPEATEQIIGEYELRAERDKTLSDNPDETSAQLTLQRRLRLAATAAAREKLMEHTDEVETDKHRAMG